MSPEISFFPLPLPDELFDSVVYRYHQLSGNVNVQNTFEALFGKSNTVAPRLMTASMDAMFKRIPAGIFTNSDELIDQLTLVPAFAAIFTGDQMSRVRASSHRSTMGVTTLYRSPLRIIHSQLHCCPMCIQEEVERIGVAYWHRSHQLDGVVVCHLHGCDLISRCPHCSRPVRTERSFDLPSPLCHECNKALPTVFGYPESVRELAVWAHDALSSNIPTDNENWLAMEVLQRTQGESEGFCADILKRYGKRYCESEKKPYYSLRGNWLNAAYKPHRLYDSWGRWTLKLRSLTDSLIVAHSLFDSWEAMTPPDSDRHAA